MTNDAREFRAIVIGGGFAGVSAAVRLREHGARVTVLESRPVLGGRARSDRLGDTTIDVGAQLIASSFTRTRALLATGDDALVTSPGRDLIVRDGTREPIHFGSIRSLLGFGGLSAGEKLKLGATVLPMLLRHRAHLDALGERMPAALDRERARRYLASHVGSTAADLLAEPPVNSFYAAAGDDVSLGFLLALAHFGSDSHMLAAPDGWSAALARALGDVECVLEVVVDGVHATDADGVTVRAGSRTWTANGVVIATGARAAYALLRDHDDVPDELVRWLTSVETRRTITLALSVDGALDRQAFGIFADPATARTVAAAAVHGAKLAEHASAGGEVVLAWPTPEAAPQLSEAAPSQVVDAMLPELDALVPGVAARVTRARIYRFPEGTPVPGPGHAAAARRARELCEQIRAPIALAGDYLSLPMVEGAVESGERAAERLLRVSSRRPLAGERSSPHI